MGADELPKPLHLVGPEAAGSTTSVSFLERQVSCLEAVGVKDVAVVVGWRKELIQKRLQGRVTFVENVHPVITESGTTHSLQFASLSEFRPFHGSEAVLLLDGDIAYERRLLRSVLDAPARTCVVVAPGASSDNEEVRVYADAAAPRLMGKGLQSPVIDGLQLLGEFTGIWRIEPSEFDLVRSLITWLVGVPGTSRGFGFSKIASEHEELAQYLMTLKRLDALVLSPELLFMEADSPEDLARLRSQVYPRILERDAR